MKASQEHRLSPETAAGFRTLVYERALSCRRDLPWRNTRDPYAILVSELMLQQTQVVRVIAKFESWMQRFPDADSLAFARQEEVLSLWSGLGYNRRALALHRAAAMLVTEYGSAVPRDEAALLKLPGVGVYTARAVLAFAFDIPSAFLETNIRTVLLRHFFPGEEGVKDAELFGVAEIVLDREQPRVWYNALMDYGVALKKEEGNHSARAAGYRKQEAFSTSFRRVRGEVLRRVLARSPLKLSELHASLPFSMESIERCARVLAGEGFVEYDGFELRLPSVLLSEQVHEKSRDTVEYSSEN